MLHDIILDEKRYFRRIILRGYFSKKFNFNMFNKYL
jgi:hypothetical protein